MQPMLVNLLDSAITISLPLLLLLLVVVVARTALASCVRIARSVQFGWDQAAAAAPQGNLLLLLLITMASSLPLLLLLVVVVARTALASCVRIARSVQFGWDQAAAAAPQGNLLCLGDGQDAEGHRS